MVVDEEDDEVQN
jgi:hypothetical protein